MCRRGSTNLAKSAQNPTHSVSRRTFRTAVSPTSDAAVRIRLSPCQHTVFAVHRDSSYSEEAGLRGGSQPICQRCRHLRDTEKTRVNAQVDEHETQTLLSGRALCLRNAAGAGAEAVRNGCEVSARRGVWEGGGGVSRDSCVCDVIGGAR